MKPKGQQTCETLLYIPANWVRYTNRMPGAKQIICCRSVQSSEEASMCCIRNARERASVEGSDGNTSAFTMMWSVLYNAKNKQTVLRSVRRQMTPMLPSPGSGATNSCSRFSHGMVCCASVPNLPKRVSNSSCTLLRGAQWLNTYTHISWLAFTKKKAFTSFDKKKLLQKKSLDKKKSFYKKRFDKLCGQKKNDLTPMKL